MTELHLLLTAARMSVRLVLHRLRTGAFLLLLTGLLAPAAQAAPPTDWRWLLPSQPLPPPFYPGELDIAFGNGRFVGVNGWGGVVTSPDGLNWTPILPGTFDYFSSITFDGGKFVACAGRSIGTSLNGTQWEFHPQTGVRDNDSLDVVEYLGGMFVGIGAEYLANGQAGVLYTSADGNQWTRRLRLSPPSASTFFEVYFFGVVHGNGRFVLTASEHDYTSSEEESVEVFTYTSLNGIQWTKNLIPVFNEPPMVHAEAGFMLGDNGRILVSPDGINWEIRHEWPTAGGWWHSYGIAAAGNRIVCYFVKFAEDDNWTKNEHFALASEDGFSWQETPLPLAENSRRLFSDGSTFFMLGTDSVLSSPDGIVWTERFTPHPLDAGTASLSDVVYGDHGFVAVGMGGTVLASADGLAWERRASGTELNLTGVIYAEGRYVASGQSGTIIHSPDGQTWTSAALEGVTLWLGPMSYGAGRFVVATPDIDTGVFWTSEDGIAWQIRSSPAFRFFYGIQSLAFGNGRFVATGLHNDSLNGNHSAVSFSEDGITWQRVALPAPYTTTEFRGLIFDGARFLGRSQFGVLLTSPDGVSWKSLDDGRYSAIGYGDGNLLALREGGIGWDPIFLLQASPDGSSWTTAAPLRFGSGGLIFAYGAGRFVGVGGTRDLTARLLVSGFTHPLALPQIELRREAARLLLRVRGSAGSRWTLQRSTTLQDWETVGPLTLGTEPLEVDVTPSTETHGFWRLAAPDQ